MLPYRDFRPLRMRISASVRTARRRPSLRAACAASHDGRARRGRRPVTDEQDVHRLDRIGQSELLAHGFGLKHADPQRVESERCGGEHHVVGDDRGVDVADTLAVVLAGPHLGGVGADDDGRRSPEVARTACEALHSLRRFDDDEPLRLPVGARGGHAPRFENGGEFFGFDLPVEVLAAGIPLFGQCEKIHIFFGFRVSPLRSGGGGAVARISLRGTLRKRRYEKIRTRQNGARR